MLWVNYNSQVILIFFKSYAIHNEISKLTYLFAVLLLFIFLIVTHFITTMVHKLLLISHILSQQNPNSSLKVSTLKELNEISLAFHLISWNNLSIKSNAYLLGQWILKNKKKKSVFTKFLIHDWFLLEQKLWALGLKNKIF